VRLEEGELVFGEFGAWLALQFSAQRLVGNRFRFRSVSAYWILTSVLAMM